MEQIGIALTYKGKILEPAENGHLGNGKLFEDRTNIELILTIPLEESIQVYETDQADKSQLKRLTTNLSHEGSLVYSRKFSLRKDVRSGVRGALYPRMTHNNTNRLVVVCYDDDNNFEMWEVGLFAQDGEIYFAKQMTRAGWTEDTSKLPKLEERSESLPDPDLPDNVGKVEWFNLPSGTGVVLTNKGPAHIYWGEIELHTALFGKLRKLETGEFVVFGRLEESDPKHSIPYQIKGGAVGCRHVRPMDVEIENILDFLSSSAKAETEPKFLTFSPFANLGQ